jgi:biopolymer transport protein ExbD
MAEIQPKADSGGGGKKRAKKMSTKIDMTPMVDLAFLLLTFFMLTTTFAKPNVMDLNMPAKPKTNEEPSALKESEAFTVIISGNNKVYYYAGMNSNAAKPTIQVTNFGPKGIRQVILGRQQQQPKTVVLIKTDDKAVYRNMVDILDEMNITNQKKYAMVKITKEDEALIKDSGL